MKAMVLNKLQPVEQGPLTYQDVPVPEPGPGQVQVKVEKCGVCHTDLHTVEGEIVPPALPVIPGHQVVGEVKKLGRGARLFRVGDRVGMAWLHQACGKCKFCREGLENLCGESRYTGFHADGGYAEYTVVPEDFAYRIPEGFSSRDAAPLLCAGIIGYRALRLSEVRPGQRLGLFGFGASAHVAIQVARHWACEVYVFSRGREHRRLAEKLGAAWTGTAYEEPPEKMDGSIMFAPAGELVLPALRWLEKGGTLALAGIYMTPIPEMEYEPHIFYEKKLRSVTASTRRDGRELLDLAAEIPIRTETELFRLEDANRVLLLLKEGKINGAGVLEVQ